MYVTKQNLSCYHIDTLLRVNRSKMFNFPSRYYLYYYMTCFITKHSKFGVGSCCPLDLFLLSKTFFAKIFRH